MFIANNQVRMHDTDMAGILYFSRIFRFAHDALEDFLSSMGISFSHLFGSSEYAFVIVHAESNYFVPLHVGDRIAVHLTIEAIGTTSFTVGYKIYREEALVGDVKTVHVTLEGNTRKKIPIPKAFRELIQKHFQ